MGSLTIPNNNGSKLTMLFPFRTYGIVSIARHIETGMYVAIKKFKESDDNEYVQISNLMSYFRSEKQHSGRYESSSSSSTTTS